MQAGPLTAAERSMMENHKRVNETGQAMNEATPCIPVFAFSRSMNCFITIKDKTGINDTFTFLLSTRTLSQSPWKPPWSLDPLVFTAAGSDSNTSMQWEHVSFDIIRKFSLLGTWADPSPPLPFFAEARNCIFSRRHEWQNSANYEMMIKIYKFK